MFNMSLKINFILTGPLFDGKVNKKHCKLKEFLVLLIFIDSDLRYNILSISVSTAQRRNNKEQFMFVLKECLISQKCQLENCQNEDSSIF